MIPINYGIITVLNCSITCNAFTIKVSAFFYCEVTDMPDTIESPVLEVFSRWGAAVSKITGADNYSMDGSETNASGKKAYAQLYMLGNPITRGDLEGDECATMPSFQVNCFTSGSKALTRVYELDKISHKTMVSMGFRRTYGPEPMFFGDSGIKKLVSRYSRIYTGTLLD